MIEIRSELQLVKLLLSTHRQVNCVENVNFASTKPFFNLSRVSRKAASLKMKFPHSLRCNFLFILEWTVSDDIKSQPWFNLQWLNGSDGYSDAPQRHDLVVKLQIVKVRSTYPCSGAYAKWCVDEHYTSHQVYWTHTIRFVQRKSFSWERLAHNRSTSWQMKLSTRPWNKAEGDEAYSQI